MSSCLAFVSHAVSGRLHGVLQIKQTFQHAGRHPLPRTVLQGCAGRLCSTWRLPTAFQHMEHLADSPTPLVQVEMDIAHHRTLLDLHHKVNMRERIVGW